MSETFSEWVRRQADKCAGDGDELLRLMAAGYEDCISDEIFAECRRVEEDVELLSGEDGRHVAYAVAMTAVDVLHAIYTEGAIERVKESPDHDSRGSEGGPEDLYDRRLANAAEFILGGMSDDQTLYGLEILGLVEAKLGPLTDDVPEDPDVLHTWDMEFVKQTVVLLNRAAETLATRFIG